MFDNAEAYERFMGRWSRHVAPLLVEFTDIPDRGRVLDVGSGTGSLAFAIAARKERSYIVGVDASREYIAYANERNPFADRVSFQVADAQTLPFPDATFHASLSLLAFNLIPDPREALQELRRVTKPGGPITAAVWDYGAGMRMLGFFWDAAASLDATTASSHEKHMPLCRAGELSQVWRESDMENVHEQPLDIAMQFESFSEYWDPFLLGQGPAGAYVRTLSREQVQALRAEVKRRLLVTVEEEPFTLTARAWAVRGDRSSPIALSAG